MADSDDPTSRDLVPSTDSGTISLPVPSAPLGPTHPVELSAASQFLVACSPWEVGFTFLDDSTVEGVLGQGGMGIVYRVCQHSSGRSLAVKRARFVHHEGRRRFLTELQIWNDLPSHPHLVPCRFFRTVDEEVVIFMDLAEGGSLADWITEGRLTRLADILDLAIQVAWGLHALHERGFVHQDVKPANVLMSAAGLARVADFGLGRARARLLAAQPQPSGQSVLVTCGAMTPAYCSPEQALGQPVSRKTDLWSWGVLVLEMFCGKVPCCLGGGMRAAEVLEAWLAGPAPERPMPDPLVALLRRCFASTPAERWPDLANVAGQLIDLYEYTTEQEYPRTIPVASSPVNPPLVAPPRQSGLLGGSRSPRQWLTLAWRAAGRDATELEAILPPAASSRRGQAVADLAVHEETVRLLERLIQDGRLDLEPQLAALLVQKASVHASVHDWPGAFDLFERAANLWQQLIYGYRRQELTPNLVRTWLARASALRARGDNQAAIAECDRVIQLWQKLDNRRARQELREDLAAACLDKGLALRALGRAQEALGLYARSIELYEQLVARDDQEDLANELAQAYLSQAGVLNALGESRQALERCDDAIQIRRRLVQREGRQELRGDLARAYLHKASVHRFQENATGAIPLYEQALALFTHLVHQEGRDDLEPELARAYLSFANARRSLEEHTEASRLCGQALLILERLVYQEGRPELMPDLARAHLHRANALRAAGSLEEALPGCDRAIALYEWLVEGDEHRELANELARAWIARANADWALGQLAPARELYVRADELRRKLCAESAREDIVGDRARDRVSLAELLRHQGEHDLAVQELTAALVELEDLTRRTRRGDLRSALNRGRRLAKEWSPPVEQA
jgi:serine/threonine protein kinase